MTQRSAWGTGLAAVALCLVVVLLGLCAGSSGLDTLGRALLDASASDGAQATARQILWEIRLPRTLGALAAGALLGLAGALAQGLFRNPLADPFLLGSASGASLGVALALAFAGGAVWGAGESRVWVHLGLTGAAFLGAVLAVALTLLLSRGVQHTLRLLLAGVVVGVVLGACSSLVLVLQPALLQTMQGFLLGSTSLIAWPACVLMLLVWVFCASIAWTLGRFLDALSLGQATARSLGLASPGLRGLLIAVLALATATAVAQTGLIAFVGLAAPHLVRATVRVSHRQLVWLASAAGALLLAGSDLLARSVLAPQDLPVGLLTAVLGGGYLLWLMRRGAPGNTV